MLAATHTVYAPDLPGFGASEPLALARGEEPDPGRYATAVSELLHAVVAEHRSGAVVVAGSFGGGIAVHLARRHPESVVRLVLVASAGLGRYVNPMLRLLTLPWHGDAAVRWAMTDVGAAQRAWLRLPLLFAQPGRAPAWWIGEQQRLARTPHHLRTTLAALRAQVTPLGQRKSMLADLEQLAVPTTVVWGAADMVLPPAHGRAAVERLREGALVVIPDCGHLSHLEQPRAFVEAVTAAP